jgi:hypothetical protein
MRTWATVRDLTYFDQMNHWLIDHGDGTGLPSVNLVIFSYVNPLKLLNKVNDARTVNGVPVGMNQAFIDAYRSMLPNDATGSNPAARLTIDLGSGNRWLIPLNQKTAANWLLPSNPVLHIANAMVPNRQPSASGAIAN